MCILRVLPEKTSERIGQERAGTEWTVVKSKIRLCIRNHSYGRFLHGGILMGIALPIPAHRAKSHDFACWWPAAADHSRSADACREKIKFLILERRPHAKNEEKSEIYRKDKSNLRTSTETVHELLHRQAEDAGMTLSEFAAQMLMKGRVNTSYVFYVHPDEIEAITREFAAIGNNLNQIAAFFNSGGLPSHVMRENINHAISCIFEMREQVAEMAGKNYGNLKAHRK